MDRRIKNKVNQIAKLFTNLGEEFRILADLLDEREKMEGVTRKQPGSQKDSKELIEKIKNSPREEAEKILASLKQEKLAQIFSTFGSSRDRKKPKAWLIE